VSGFSDFLRHKGQEGQLPRSSALAPRRRACTSNILSLDKGHRLLSQADTIKKVKQLRDQAEAARNYAQCARLSLEKQNQFAEFKLRCEIKAGRLLIELGIGRGGPRKKRSHRGTFLENLRISKNHSSRWQQQARVPEELLERYLSTSRKSGEKITAHAFLRLAKHHHASVESAHVTSANGALQNGTCERASPMKATPNPGEIQYQAASEAIADLVGELFEHRRLLADILNDFCTQSVVRPKPIEQRTAARLLLEMHDSLTTLAAINERKDSHSPKTFRIALIARPHRRTKLVRAFFLQFIRPTVFFAASRSADRYAAPRNYGAPAGK
jgi:hypothetical protein